MPLPEKIRTTHPYFMYQEIQAQPDAVAHAVQHGRAADSIVIRHLRDARRISVLGNGTSYHAAQAGAAILQQALPSTDVRAAQAFEYLTYQTPVMVDDVVLVVSHAGETAMSVAALQYLERTPSFTIAVTGFPHSTVAKSAGSVLTTGYEAEHSWAHTVSYTAAIALFGGLAVAAGDTHSEAGLLKGLMDLPDLMQQVLGLEPQVRQHVGEVSQARSVWFAGPGSNQVTAVEAALKMIETSHVTAVGLELEQTLHGYFPAMNGQDVLWLIAPGSESSSRTKDVLVAAEVIGIRRVGQFDPHTEGLLAEQQRLVLPSMQDVLSPILHILTLQLLSYWVALERGLNPDLIGRGSAEYLKAAESYE